MGAYKLTRHIYEKLHSLHIPTKFRDAIEINDLTIRGKPFSDAEVNQTIIIKSINQLIVIII